MNEMDIIRNPIKFEIELTFLNNCLKSYKTI